MHMNQTQASAGAETRRSFIKKAATVTAAAAATNLFKTPVYGQGTAPSTGRVIGANDRIVVGFVGVGPQGQLHVDKMKTNAEKNNVALAGVCDLWEKRREMAKAKIGGDVKLYDDYHKLLENKDIDAVICATVDHWHARVSVDTMKAGKHIYVEKPMARYLPEAFEVWDTVKATGKQFQVGSQGCSDAMWLKAAELVSAGKIGKLVLGQTSYMRNSPKGEWNYTIDPDFKEGSVNWETWLGPKLVTRHPFYPDHYFRWRKYYQYCAGLLGDLLPHRIHPLILATGNPEFPVRVCAIGTKNILTDKNTPGTPIRDCPECLTLIAEFPSGFQAMICIGSVNEKGLDDIVRGHMATLQLGGSKVELRPERPFTDDLDPEDYAHLTPVEDVGVHESNWLDSIRSGKPPHANIELAVRAQTVISLAEMSDRMGIACHFDEKTRSVLDATGKKIEIANYGVLKPS